MMQRVQKKASSAVPECFSAAWGCRCPRRRTRRRGTAASRAATGRSATAASSPPASPSTCFVTGIPEAIDCFTAAAPHSDPSLSRLRLSRGRARGFYNDNDFAPASHSLFRRLRRLEEEKEIDRDGDADRRDIFQKSGGGKKRNLPESRGR